MTADTGFARFLTKSPSLALALYLAVAGALIFATCAACLDIVDRTHALKQTTALLAELQARRGGTVPGALLAAEPAGSPFLEGRTVTVAGAALLQRVAAAVQGVGGTVQSSSVDVAGTQASDGIVRLRVGQSHAGWSLTSILPREATLTRGDRAETLVIRRSEPAAATDTPSTGAPSGASYAPFVPRSMPKNGAPDGL